MADARVIKTESEIAAPRSTFDATSEKGSGVEVVSVGEEVAHGRA